MMQRDAFIRTRTDSYLKEQAELVFARLGINMTDAINMFLAQVALQNAIPFMVSVPQTDTEFYRLKQEALEDRKRQLADAIAEGEADFATGRFLTIEESKARTRSKIELLQKDRG
jgi:DNA-damage-inducible protein J